MSAAYAVLLLLVSVVKRMLCFLHITRRRKNSGSILPLHADVKMLSVGEIQSSLPSNNVSFYLYSLIRPFLVGVSNYHVGPYRYHVGRIRRIRLAMV